MGKLPFMKFYPQDFDRDMSAHSLEIRGAWITIIDHLWNSNDTLFIGVSNSNGSIMAEFLRQ
jgi:uncharacterized protein YdaU (DUF1376 family)